MPPQEAQAQADAPQGVEVIATSPMPKLETTAITASESKQHSQEVIAQEPKPTRRAIKPAKGLVDLIGQSPTNSVEYKLYKGLGACLLNKDIERAIEYYQTNRGRHFTTEYKRAAIAYLQEELGKRRRAD